MLAVPSRHVGGRDELGRVAAQQAGPVLEIALDEAHGGAEEVGVHISTVSRAISGKYIQTPQGIFEMKRFFSGGTLSDSGEMVSQRAIKQRLQAIVEREDRRAPLSDDDIVEKLKAEGLNIARRTVTKYRKALGIPASSRRKDY